MNAARFILVALVTALAAHAAIILAAPRIIMDAAMQRVGAEGPNRWTHVPRVTEDSRGVVRPSPDLAYSTCVFDLSRGPVQIRVLPWRDYVSLSLYAANTDNFFVVSDRQAPHGFDVTLVRRGQRAPDGAANVVESPSSRGVALVRRLAPSVEAFAAADETRQGDVCEAAG